MLVNAIPGKAAGFRGALKASAGSLMWPRPVSIVCFGTGSSILSQSHAPRRHGHTSASHRKWRICHDTRRLAFSRTADRASYHTRGPCLNQHIGTERPTCALWWQRCARMPRYRFNVLDTDRFDDEDGVILPDDKTAGARAMQIIHELQKADEASGSGYTMEVLREGRVVWRIPFEVSDPPS